MRSIWISWEDHRRSRELAAHFGAALHTLTSDRARLFRYPVLLVRTFALIVREKPTTLFCQNPSIFLAWLAALLRPVFGYQLVVDRHSNFAQQRRSSRELKWMLFHSVSDFSIRNAALTIVTNDTLARHVSDLGGHPYVLTDKLPTMNAGPSASSTGKHAVVVVNTFSPDEPLAEIFAAASALGQDYQFYVTGSRARFERFFSLDIPENVELTGFLPEQDYVDLLAGVDAVMVLTLSDNVLNCGAYEAVSLGKPMILSDTAVIREYFSAGAVYVKPDPQSIAGGITQLFENLDEYAEETRNLAKDLKTNWDLAAHELEQKLTAKNRI